MQAPAIAGTTFSVDDLGGALERRELHVLYQPVFDAVEGSIVAVEALLRWRHPQFGLLAPVPLIEFAAVHGRMPEITEFVLDHACREASAWPSLALAINVSPDEFGDGGLGPRVAGALARTGFPASRLVIEIVESSAFSNPAMADAELDKLRSLGVRAALDDFGSGHSSLLLLQKLSFDIVKIDKALIDAVAEARAAKVVRSIVDLAHGLGAKVTAEGVETEEQRRMLVAAGCDFLQGYLLSRPVEADRIRALLAAA